MATEQKIPVFDGHNDVLLRLWSSEAAAPEKRFLDGENVGHIDLPRARRRVVWAADFAQCMYPRRHANSMPTATSRRPAKRMR